jgi:tRNA-dihydrouridine synthase A|tara:strand:- start:3262 stop:4197 length:936 start_codon:yes stop_codon:yes gene_type:complete
MMGCTDRHCRKLFRLISPHTLLFTEMVVTGALIHGDAPHYLRHSNDGPCVMQLGGSNPIELAQSAKMAEAAGYQEINLNVGCPSDRVQYGGIGACLMAEPQLVADCMSAMQQAVAVPVSVKCRIGIDDHQDYEFFRDFIEVVAKSGCSIFYVHARNAILKGLSPKENREIPPLKYDYVDRIIKDFPSLSFYLNGGLKTCQDVESALERVPGVMLGRAPYSNPYLLAEIEAQVFNHEPVSRQTIVDQYVSYGKSNEEAEQHPKHLLKHLLGLYTGLPGARHFRRHLSENMFEPNVSMNLVYDALEVSGLRDK